MDAFKALGLLAAGLWFASAVLWALGAMVEIHDNQDAFVGDMACWTLEQLGGCHSLCRSLCNCRYLRRAPTNDPPTTC